MTVPMPVLKAKLTPPALRDTLALPVYRLLLNTILERRVTTITAGAGFGKTALAARVLEDLGVPTVWYRLDAADRELPCFLNYLIHGICRVLPEFDPAPVRRALEAVMDEGLPDAGLGVLTLLLAEMETGLAKDLVVVLDDFHLVKTSKPVLRAVRFFLDHAAGGIHLVLVGREAAPVSLARFKARQELLSVTQADLTFSKQETVQFCSEILSTGWDTAVLDKIWAMTRGWVAGLTLCHHAFRGLAVAHILERMDSEFPLPRTIASYFEEEIIPTVSTETRRFLVQTSILDYLDPVFCDEWLGRDDSGNLLTKLFSGHVFVRQRVSAGRILYEYQNCFRLFLRQKAAADFSNARTAQLHRKAAATWQGMGRADLAVSHFLAAQEYEGLLKLLDEKGRFLFQEGRFDMLNACMDQIPSRFIRHFPWVLCLFGRLRGISGDYPAAARSYDLALDGFAGRDDTEGMYLCQIEIALSRYMAGHFSDAAGGLAELLSGSGMSDELRIEALGYLIYLTTHLRHRDEWDTYCAVSRSVLADLETADLDIRLKIWLDIYRGHTCIAAGDYEKAMDIGRSVEWRVQMLEQPEAFYGHNSLMAAACYFLHRFEEGLVFAVNGLAAMDREYPETGSIGPDPAAAVPVWQPARPTPAGVRDRGGQDTMRPILMLQAARNAFGLGRSGEAVAHARKSVAIFKSMGMGWGQALGMSTLSTAYARQGNIVLAEQSARAGLGLVQGLDLPLTRGTLMGNLAVILMMNGKYGDALPLIENAATPFAALGLSRWIDLWRAMHDRQQNPGRGRIRFSAALKRFARRADYGIAAERHWIVPYLVDTYARGDLKNYILNTLKKIGSDAVLDLRQVLRESGDSAVKSAASGLLKVLPKPDPPGLQIHLLGRFRVFVGGIELPAAEWGNRKIRSLFQYLAWSRPGGYVNRDVLIEMLWPEQDPNKTKNRFHVAMTTLRRILEPDLPTGAPSSYLSRVGDTYRLDLGKDGRVDADIFTGHMTRAARETDPGQALRHCLAAVTAYEGDLLAEAPYCQWGRDPRERLRERYLSALETIIAYYRQLADFERCIEYAEAYLSADRTSETIYGLLMTLYADLGRPVRVAATLKRCRRNLREELDCPPSPEIEILADRLLGAEPGA